MADLLWLIPALPFMGFLVLALAGSRLPRLAAALIGCGAVGLSALTAIVSAIVYMAGGAHGPWVQTLWTWWDVGGLAPGVTLYLDPLAIVFTLVITVVGFLIHVYSIGYMHDDEAYSRFFAYMNLFVGAMLMLVLGDNLLLLYLGWEGVGLCSYLLIGFWYADPANGRAARKAFVVTRVGDTAMAIGIFLLFWHLGTIQIQPLLARAVSHWPVGSALATTAALLLLGGAVGKSAQLPLQTWLPDAMAGPTPVSALIHAATMVTAGVYLIARTHALFALAPAAMLAVGIVGALTLLIAGCSALVQSDIKRVLAYSTISQIGYMFLALGVGAWSAAIFHFMTHAFFKALLFLGAGAVIIALQHEQDIFKMGGLKRSLPVVFWTFLIGSASLAALPLVTSGFYSKDLILWEAWAGPAANHWLCAAGLVGAAFTAVYTFRLVFLVFYGGERTHVHHRPGAVILVPLVILAVLSTLGGFVETPATLGGVTAFSDFMAGTFGAAAGAGAGHSASLGAGHAAGHGAANGHGHGEEALLQLVAAAISLGGLGLAWLLYGRRPAIPRAWAATPVGARVRRFWFSGWGFDALYDVLVVRPYGWIARVNKADGFDSLYTGLANLVTNLHRSLVRTQSGRLRLYAAGIAAGAIVALAIMVFG
jgi:NADH-quinone oxidoreductase subunit L